MEKNDIFNTNLLQLPLKAQVADEGVVQDIAPVAEPTAPAMGEGLVLDMLAQDGGVLRRLSNVTPKKCEKLASGFLHRGEITLLCGDGGVGKVQFVAQIAKSLTTGEATEFFPQAPEGTGNIVILAGEDPIDTVLCPRMDAAGADLNKVAVIAPDTYYEEMHKMPQLGDPDLMNWIAAGDPLLLVIDPFQAFLPDSVNLNNRQQIRSLLQLLRMQAQQHGFAILLVTHTNKNPGACGRKRLNGSGELWDTARNVLIMGHAKNGNKIYVSHEKSSYDAPTDTILFTTETVTVKGVKTARAKFDSTSDWKDEDFCREKPDRVAPKYAGVQSRILVYKTVHHNFCISRNRGQRSLQLMGNICREFSPHLFNCCFFFILPVNSFKQRMQLFIYIIFQWFFQIQIVNRCNQPFHLMPCHKPCNTCHHDPDRNHIR